MRRRYVITTLARSGAVALLGFGLRPTGASATGLMPVATMTPYGLSREQRPLVDFRFPDAAIKVLVVGGIHAGLEANTVDLVQSLFAAAQADPTLAPEHVSLTFLVSANPDGLADDTRTLASGVDPNRNWPTDDWTTDTYVAGPTQVAGGGGPFPLSEPETQALANHVMQLRPDMIISYHSAAGLVTGGPRARAMGLEATYADAAGYDAGDWTAYPVTGDFAQWAEARQGVPTVEIELPDHESAHLVANLAAMRATIQKLASLRGGS